MTKPRLLIDADGFLYKAAIGAEFTGDWGNGVFVLTANLDKAKDMFKSQVDAVCEKLESDNYALILSGSDNFRKKLDATYKANRVSRKPLVFTHLTDWVKETFDGCVAMQDQLEADDYIGILATRPGGEKCIIVSDDKDMQTLPCTLFRGGELSTIDRESADRYWMLQTLTGDPVDGYKGCPGAGPAKAAKVLSKAGSMWENVKREYVKAGLTEDHAILQARLARILRFEDWDSANKQPILWTPGVSPTP